MTDHFQQCPNSLQLFSYGPRRFCGRKTDANGCDSVMIPIGGKSYTEIHGKVVAYQYASTDGFDTFGSNPGIDGAYVDSISITYGQSPRKHVWTLAAGLFSYKKDETESCPGTGYGVPQPEFVANNYFCSSGNFGTNWEHRFYDTPLWSTITGDCGRSAHDVPYFCAKLPEPTTEDLELRICANQGLADEDIKIESITIYVR